MKAVKYAIKYFNEKILEAELYQLTHDLIYRSTAPWTPEALTELENYYLGKGFDTAKATGEMDITLSLAIIDRPAERPNEKLYTLDFGSLMNIYTAGFTQGVNEGMFPEHSVLDELKKILNGQYVGDNTSGHLISLKVEEKTRHEVINFKNKYRYTKLEKARE